MAEFDYHNEQEPNAFVPSYAHVNFAIIDEQCQTNQQDLTLYYVKRGAVSVGAAYAWITWTTTDPLGLHPTLSPVYNVTIVSSYRR